jgi:hypothetical protein
MFSSGSRRSESAESQPRPRGRAAGVGSTGKSAFQPDSLTHAQADSPVLKNTKSWHRSHLEPKHIFVREQNFIEQLIDRDSAHTHDWCVSIAVPAKARLVGNGAVLHSGSTRCQRENRQACQCTHASAQCSCQLDLSLRLRYLDLTSKSSEPPTSFAAA